MADIDINSLDKVIRMKLENPEEYEKYMKACAEVILDFKKMMEELME